MRKRPTAKLHFRPNLPADASPAVVLGTELRMNAELNDCCICGSRPQLFEVTKYGPEPEVRHLEEPLSNGLTHAVFVHRHDCPAASDVVERALTPTSQGG
jgi:hypothetical protein